MSVVKILNRNSELMTLSEKAVQELMQSFQGTLLQPGDDGYDIARKVWNGLIDRQPALIARCAGTADVVAAVNFAREQDLLLSVRSGGYNVSGAAVVDKGMVIDLSTMCQVQVDEKHHVVRAEGGALLGDIDRETQKFNLATPLGVVSRIGAAGLTLHGGIGWQVRKHGLSIDNLEAVEIVTADGQVVRASAHEHDDLFWAVLGSGGNFGVITAFEFRLHKLGPEVWMSMPIYPLEKASEVMAACRNYMAEAPEELMVIGIYKTAPAIEAVPGQYHGKPVVILLGCYTGRPEDGIDVIGPLCSINEPIVDLSAQMSWLEAQQFLDDDYPAGNLYCSKSICLDRFDDAVVTALAVHAKNRPSPDSSINIWFLGGAMSRIPDFATPFCKRDVSYMIDIEANWHKSEETEANVAWARAVYDDMQRFSDGSTYPTFPGFVEDAGTPLQAADGPNLSKLMKIKARYDPGNLFQGQLNIASRN